MDGIFAFLDNVFIGSSSGFPYKIHMTGSFLPLSKALPKQLEIVPPTVPVLSISAQNWCHL